MLITNTLNSVFHCLNYFSFIWLSNYWWWRKCQCWPLEINLGAILKVSWDSFGIFGCRQCIQLKRRYYCCYLLFDFILNFLLLLLFSGWLRGIHFLFPADPISKSNLKSTAEIIELKMSTSSLILKLFGIVTEIYSFVSIKINIILWRRWRRRLLLLLLLGFVYKLSVNLLDRLPLYSLILSGGLSS